MTCPCPSVIGRWQVSDLFSPSLAHINFQWDGRSHYVGTGRGQSGRKRGMVNTSWVTEDDVMYECTLNGEEIGQVDKKNK